MSKAHLHYSFATLGSAKIYTLKFSVLLFIKLFIRPELRQQLVVAGCRSIEDKNL